MSSTIFRAVTGPVTSAPYVIPPGEALSLLLGGSGFTASLEATLDPNGSDWVSLAALTTAGLSTYAPGPAKFRLVLTSGTIASAQWSSTPIDTLNVSNQNAGPDLSGSLSSVAAAATAALTATAANQVYAAGLDFSPEKYGAVGNGTTNDSAAFTSAINATRKISLSGRSYRLNSALALPSGTSLTGVRQTDYPTETSGATTVVTTASPAMTMGNSASVEGLLLKPLSTGTGVGISSDDTYFHQFTNVTFNGFAQGIVFTKAIYHLLQGVNVINSSGVGVTYGGYTGAWNIGWFNNVVTLTGCRINDNAGGNLDVRAQGLIATSCDFTGGCTTAFLDASSVLRKASVRVRAGSYDLQFNACYTERLPVGGFGYLIEGGIVQINGGFAQGGTSAGANECGAIVRATGGAKVTIRGLYAQDYWTNLIQADGAGTVVTLDGPIQGVPSPSAGRYLVTNGAQIVYKEGVIASGTIGASTGSTFTWPVPAGYTATFTAALSLNGGAIAGTISGVAYNTGSNTGAHGTSNSANLVVSAAGSNLVITNNVTYGGTVALFVTLTAL